jgi:hypothetical protein
MQFRLVFGLINHFALDDVVTALSTKWALMILLLVVKLLLTRNLHLGQNCLAQGLPHRR